MFLKKIENIRFKVEGYTDTHEYIQYRDGAEIPEMTQNRPKGHIKRPFVVWEKQVDPLVVKIRIEPEKRRELFVFIDLRNSTIPDFLEVSLREFEGEEEGPDLFIQTSNNGFGSFELLIKHEDRHAAILDPQYLCLYLGACSPRKIAIDDLEYLEDDEYAETLRKLPGYYKYELIAGPQLGDTWLGIDPGTTGSCVVGGHPSLINTDYELLLQRNDGKEEITPSRIGFVQERELHYTTEEFIEAVKNDSKNEASGLFEIGDKVGFYGAENSFQSIKKLLGYPDEEQKVVFANNKSLSLTGSDLTGLMLSELFKQFHKSLRDKFFPKVKENEWVRAGKFEPSRVVIAIPNNFTPLQIQDAVDAVSFIPGVKEVRRIYEAEAVLLYCVRYKSEHFENDRFEKNVLIFDMGGATINATSVKVSFNGSKYQFQITGKIGYALGGDSIDYYLGRTIIDASNSPHLVTELFDPIPETTAQNEKQKVIERRKHFREQVVTPFKLHIVNQFNRQAENLLTDVPSRAIQALKKFVGKSSELKFEFDKSFTDLFKLHENGEYPIFHYLQPIYESIEEATKDLGLELSPDKIIFSGRSTLFPFVRESVLKSLAGKPTVIELEDSELKTSVSKGACLYGLLNNAFDLTSDRLYENYGFTVPKGAGKMNVDFELLIKSGEAFENGKVWQAKDHLDLDFSLQSNYVNFYQVSGKDAVNIIKKGLKHKFKTVGQLATSKLVKKAAMEVRSDGVVKCGIWNRDKSKPITCINTEVQVTLAGENEPHYTWLLT